MVVVIVLVVVLFVVVDDQVVAVVAVVVVVVLVLLLLQNLVNCSIIRATSQSKAKSSDRHRVFASPGSTSSAS